MSVTKTMIVSPTHGRFVFDAVFSTEHRLNITTTQHPVQQGASISDHAYIEPDEVSIEVGMTDAAVSAGGPSHSVNAYEQLRAIAEARRPVTLVTRLHTYSNMVITSLSAPDDKTTMNALRATVYFQKINIVAVATMKVQQTVSGSKTTQNTGSTKNPSPAPSSNSNKSSNKKTSSSSKEKSKKTSVLKKTLTSAAKTATKSKYTKVLKM